jgi:hypothetical protein
MRRVRILSFCSRGGFYPFTALGAAAPIASAHEVGYFQAADLFRLRAPSGET